MRHMHEATDELYFVIDEKNNSIELTDKGIDLLTGTDGRPDLLRTSRYHFPIIPIGEYRQEPRKRNRPKKDEIYGELFR